MCMFACSDMHARLQHFVMQLAAKHKTLWDKEEEKRSDDSKII